jgi:hypothetical protein
MPNTPSGAIHGGDETSLHRASTGTEEVSAPEDNAPQVAFPPVATMTGQSGNTPSVEDLWAARRAAFLDFKGKFSTSGFDVQKWSNRGSNSTPSPRTLYASDNECTRVSGQVGGVN